MQPIYDSTATIDFGWISVWSLAQFALAGLASMTWIFTVRQLWVTFFGAQAIAAALADVSNRRVGPPAF